VKQHESRSPTKSLFTQDDRGAKVRFSDRSSLSAPSSSRYELIGRFPETPCRVRLSRWGASSSPGRGCRNCRMAVSSMPSRPTELAAALRCPIEKCTATAILLAQVPFRSRAFRAAAQTGSSRERQSDERPAEAEKDDSSSPHARWSIREENINHAKALVSAPPNRVCRISRARGGPHFRKSRRIPDTCGPLRPNTGHYPTSAASANLF
jgi:hypothetical protein